MPHIHTGAGQYDLTVAGYIVYNNTTLLIKHKYLPIWTPPSGHVELHQTPIEALYMEIEEEAGISNDHLTFINTHPYPASRIRPDNHVELPIPFDLETHPITETHSHLNLAYVLASDTNHVEPGPGESNTFTWLTIDELHTFGETTDSIRSAAIFAIEQAGEHRGSLQ